MKQLIQLTDGWEMHGFPTQLNLDCAWRQALETQATPWLSARMPAVVQEVLWEHGLLDTAVLETGEAENCRWVSEMDWAFRTTFHGLQEPGQCFVLFKALDTVADIVLNGHKIGQSISMFQPLRIELTGLLQNENELLLYFHAPSSVLPTLEKRIPPQQRDRITPAALLRKAHGDFSTHAGVIPYFTPIGVYDDIVLTFVPEAEMTWVDVETRWNQNLSQAYIHITPQWRKTCESSSAVTLKAVLYSPDGISVAQAETPATQPLTLTVDHPQLWWPRNYGNQPRYTLQTSLWMDGAMVDSDEKRLGLREIREVGSLRYLINGVRLRMWGSCMVPMWGPSHKYQEERAKTLLDLAENANINTLRFWGPSQQYSDALYEELDRRGILVWQDFPTSGAHLPEDPDFVRCVASEAEHMVRRLKHHACILHWCGGNESVYMCDLFQKEDLLRFGHDLLFRTLRDVANRLDPSRVYRISSPYGGVYPNETTIDSHGSRAALSFLPEEAHANFFSENIRTFVPEYKSLRRFIPEEELWPEGWTDHAVYGRSEPIPPAWLRRTINHWAEKNGPVEQFYDAENPIDLIYKINAAAAQDIRQILNDSRRGKSAANAQGERRTHGHLLWKLTTAWPQIYCALIDYYLEPGQAYYALRRAFAPIQVSVDVGDRVYLWGVNDTRQDFRGTLEVTIYDLEAQKNFAQRSYPAAIIAGDSRVLVDLNDIGQFWLTCVVQARLLDDRGREVSRDFQYMKSERYLPFPDAKLTLRQAEDGCIDISSDHFARCVELAGSENGDDFGWYFEDNYFDLMPGETRRLHIRGHHQQGILRAKAHYATHTSTLDWFR